MATSKGQRIAIWVIAIVMTVGTLSAYFIAILNLSNGKKQQQVEQAQQQKQLPVDPTAYKVDSDVTELQVTDLVEGQGEPAKESDTIQAHYKGTIAQTGQKFESSYDSGEPLTVQLANLIPGWKEGIPGMKVGGKRRLVIPSDKAYGEQGTASIPPNTDLVFEIELLAINPPQQ